MDIIGTRRAVYRRVDMSWCEAAVAGTFGRLVTEYGQRIVFPDRMKG